MVHRSQIFSLLQPGFPLCMAAALTVSFRQHHIDALYRRRALLARDRDESRCQFDCRPSRQFCTRLFARGLGISRIVDPRPWVERRLKEIDHEFAPQLEAAHLAVKEAGTRPDRKAAKTTLRSLRRQRRQARRRRSDCSASSRLVRAAESLRRRIGSYGRLIRASPNGSPPRPPETGLPESSWLR